MFRIRSSLPFFEGVEQVDQNVQIGGRTYSKPRVRGQWTGCKTQFLGRRENNSTGERPDLPDSPPSREPQNSPIAQCLQSPISNVQPPISPNLQISLTVASTQAFFVFRRAFQTRVAHTDIFVLHHDLELVACPHPCDPVCLGVVA